MAQRAGFINHTKVMECPQQPHMTMLHRQLQVDSEEHLRCMVVTAHWAACRTMHVLGLLSLPRHLKVLEAVEHLVELMMHSVVALHTKVKASNITTPSKVLSQAPVMT